MTPRSEQVGVLVACLAALTMLVVACGGDGSATTLSTSHSTASTTASTVSGTTTTSTPSTPEKVFSSAELAEFDGKEDRPAYIAVDGVVYDVSGSARWPEGKHLSCFLDSEAGNNLSEELKQAPSNMRALVERLPVVGRLEQ